MQSLLKRSNQTLLTRGIFQRNPLLSNHVPTKLFQSSCRINQQNIPKEKTDSFSPNPPQQSTGVNATVYSEESAWKTTIQQLPPLNRKNPILWIIVANIVVYLIYQTAYYKTNHSTTAKENSSNNEQDTTSESDTSNTSSTSLLDLFDKYFILSLENCNLVWNDFSWSRFQVPSSLLLHSITHKDVLDLTFNVLMLYRIGTLIMFRVGRYRFLQFFVGASLCGAVSYLSEQYIRLALQQFDSSSLNSFSLQRSNTNMMHRTPGWLQQKFYEQVETSGMNSVNIACFILYSLLFPDQKLTLKGALKLKHVALGFVAFELLRVLYGLDRFTTSEISSIHKENYYNHISSASNLGGAFFAYLFFKFFIMKGRF